MSNIELTNHFIQEHPIKIVKLLIDKAHSVQNNKYTQNKLFLELYHKQKLLAYKKKQIVSLKNNLYHMQNSKVYINNNHYLQKDILLEYDKIFDKLIGKEYVKDKDYQIKKFVFKELQSNKNNYEVNHATALEIQNKNINNSFESILHSKSQNHIISFKKKNKTTRSRSSIISKVTNNTTIGSNIPTQCISQSNLTKDNDSKEIIFQKIKPIKTSFSSEMALKKEKWQKSKLDILLSPKLTNEKEKFKESVLNELEKTNKIIYTLERKMKTK